MILLAAWVGAITWPVLLGWRLWRGLRVGRGPGLLGWSLVAAVSTFWVLGVWAFLWEPQTLVVRRIEVIAPSWRGEPLRIGVLSDTHGDGAQMGAARVKRIVARLNAQRPDIILLLGDYVAGHAEEGDRSQSALRAVEAGIDALEGLDAPLGVHGVLGNHDWYFNGPRVADMLDRVGVGVLDNRSRLIRREGGDFWLGGLAEYASGRRLPSFNDTLNNVPEGEPVLIMSHSPDPFAVMPGRVSLMLAGHTHCGQVNFPVLGRLMHASEGSARWPCGLYEERGRRLYVSGGVGVSILPVRFLQPPEIAVVTIRRE